MFCLIFVPIFVHITWSSMSEICHSFFAELEWTYAGSQSRRSVGKIWGGRQLSDTSSSSATTPPRRLWGLTSTDHWKEKESGTGFGIWIVHKNALTDITKFSMREVLCLCRPLTNWLWAMETRRFTTYRRFASSCEVWRMIVESSSNK